MGPEVRCVRVESQPLAMVTRTTSRQKLAADIVAGFDIVWPVLRKQNVRTGRNVVVYPKDGPASIQVGVEISADFREDGEVHLGGTPAGDAATATHYGEYSELGRAWEAIDEWCEANGWRRLGPGWEVYGHWTADAAERRTDVYVLVERSVTT